LGDLFFEFEFLGAEIGFAFLDFGVAFADGGVLGFVDKGPELVEGGEVAGLGVAVEGEGEVEGLLFEDFEGVGGEGGVAGSGVFADFGGGFLRLGKVIQEVARGAAFVVAGDGHVGDLDLELGAAEFGDFPVRDGVIEPDADAVDLLGGKAGETG
jgi:hypothetical protein